MKKLLLLSLLSFSTYAANWMSITTLKNQGVAAFEFQFDCEKQSQESCIDVKEYPSKVFSEKTYLEDDFTKPNFSKHDIVSCISKEDCDTKFQSHVCTTDTDEYKIENLDLFEIYCTKVSSYGKKEAKKWELDQAKVAQWESEKTALKQTQAKERDIQLAIKRIDYGKRVLALMIVLNSQKTLTMAQITQQVTTYAPIKMLLETGSLNTAKAAIQAIVADGVLIAETDKSALIAEIDKFSTN